MVSIAATTFVLLNACLTITAFVLAYLLTFSVYELEEYPYYFLSSSIDQYPASNVGSLLISPASFCIPFIAYIRYVVVQSKNANLRSNKYAVWIAIISAIGGHGVASFQASADLSVHLSFAGFFFGGSWFYLLITVYIDRKVPEAANKKAILLRQVVVALSAISLAAMCGTWYFKVRPLEWPYSEKENGYLVVVAYMEIALFFTIMSVYLTFVLDFSKFHLHVTVHRDDDDTQLEEDENEEQHKHEVSM
mmetsp:Transcript_20341/g.24694  ORF Transcript_20341/g.24694 Transcript_20341/m.24694 type:complete len:249 (-) Transcript_20341:387-1133(-)